MKTLEELLRSGVPVFCFFCKARLLTLEEWQSGQDGQVFGISWTDGQRSPAPPLAAGLPCVVKIMQSAQVVATLHNLRVTQLPLDCYPIKEGGV